MKTKHTTLVIKAKRRAKIANTKFKDANTKFKDIDEYFRRDDDDDFNPFQFFTEINHTPTGYIQSSIRLNY